MKKKIKSKLVYIIISVLELIFTFLIASFTESNLINILTLLQFILAQIVINIYYLRKNNWIEKKSVLKLSDHILDIISSSYLCFMILYYDTFDIHMMIKLLIVIGIMGIVIDILSIIKDSDIKIEGL